MQDLLPEFLRTAAAAPHRFGEWDCAMTLANWFMFATGHPDPAAHLRGTYGSQLGWSRIVRAAGGLVALVDGIAVRIGAHRTEDPLPGDFAVVRLPRFGETGAIHTSMGWAMKLDAGVTIIPAELVAAWRFDIGDQEARSEPAGERPGSR